MAGNTKKKKTANKSNSKKKTTTTKKSTAKKTNTNKKKPVKKTTGTSKKKVTNKTTSTKKSTTTKKTTNKPKVEKEKVVKKEEKKQPKVEEVKETSIINELKMIKDKALDKKNQLIKKYKALSKYAKIFIWVACACLIIIIIEALIFINNRSTLDSSTVYHDSYNAITVSENSLVLAGNSDFKYSTVNDFSQNSRGKLVKYNEMGELVFEKQYKKGISTTLNDVIEVSDGYVVVGTGVFSKDEKENEGREAFILKYSKDGELIWEKFYQVLTNTGFNRVVAVSDGYIAIGQSIYANMELGNHTTGGGIIVKYDLDGNEVWHNNHGGTKSGSFNDITVVNNDIYVVGKDGADSGNLVKYNSDGEYQWHKNYSYTDSYGLTGITKSNDALYVVGSKKILPKDVKEEDDRYTTNTDGLLIKYDMDGNIIFEKTFGGSSYELYNRIIQYHNNFYVVGHICSRDAGLKITNDKDDEMTGLIVRYDGNGNILKKETFGGSNNDNLTDIGTDGTSFYVVGYSNSKDGNMTTGRVNGRDYFGKLLKLNSRFKKMFDR